MSNQVRRVIGIVLMGLGFAFVGAFIANWADGDAKGMLNSAVVVLTFSLPGAACYATAVAELRAQREKEIARLKAVDEVARASQTQQVPNSKPA